MMQNRFPRVEIPAATFLNLALLLLVLPVRWIAGATVAAVIHETGHLCALKLLRVSVLKLRIGISGAVIETGPMSATQELICAAAGPAAGALTVLAAQKFPVVALCGIFQTCYNIIPIYPSDGARVLRGLLPSNKAEKIGNIISYCCLAAIAILALLLMRYTILGIMPFAAVVFLAAKSGILKNTLQRLREQCTIVPL